MEQDTKKTPRAGAFCMRTQARREERYLARGMLMAPRMKCRGMKDFSVPMA